MTTLPGDSHANLVFTMVVTVLLAIVAFRISFAGLVAVASWAGIPAWATPRLPIVIDGAHIAFTAEMLVHKVHGESVTGLGPHSSSSLA
ncbi:DUF2637 domain-containing protein [Cellulosimicrobium sp. CUA-896]|uniref:DUF2637 domain-containing protein n=1 Tax=Cellulosimicrobium sp. CUA-896 TaxID=1517881 RepID=UPI0011152358|nr:DUF2637 domain-containing protein [Cellulosimicrobium sp. CUA-896]